VRLLVCWAPGAVSLPGCSGVLLGVGAVVGFLSGPVVGRPVVVGGFVPVSRYLYH
jgi:hypothetical protein